MKTILVVDDEFDLANTLRAILQGEGFGVETCHDGRAALERLNDPSAVRPDLVLMDVMMPRSSGLDVLRTMRGTAGLGEIPVILMSVIVPSVAKAEYRWDGFLRKPFTLQAVVKAVHQHVGEGAGARD